MYQAIFTIVDKGNAEHVIDAAVAAGSRGGTIINGRGSGVHETARMFGFEIEPEKEVVLVLALRQDSENIVTSIHDSMDLDKPGTGIIFVQDVARVRGVYTPNE